MSWQPPAIFLLASKSQAPKLGQLSSILQEIPLYKKLCTSTPNHWALEFLQTFPCWYCHSNSLQGHLASFPIKAKYLKSELKIIGPDIFQYTPILVSCRPSLLWHYSKDFKLRSSSWLWYYLMQKLAGPRNRKESHLGLISCLCFAHIYPVFSWWLRGGECRWKGRIIADF